MRRNINRSSLPYTPTPDEDLSLSQAVMFFGLSPYAILKRVREGFLKGYKVRRQNRPEWRIHRTIPNPKLQPCDFADTSGDWTIFKPLPTLIFRFLLCEHA